MPKRRYTDSEVRAILAKAIDDQAAQLPAPSEGLSLDEIKEIGAGVGVDGVAIEKAAHSLGSLGASRPARLVGAPTQVLVERKVSGTLDHVPRGELLSAIRAGMSRPGSLTETDGLFEWQHEGELGRRIVTLSTSGDETTVGAMADLGSAAVVTYTPLGAVATIGALLGFADYAKAGSLMGLVIAVLLLPLAYLIARGFFTRFSRSEEQKLERVVERVALLVEESNGDSSVR